MTASLTDIETRNPATGERLRGYATFSPAEIDAALERTRAAFALWRDTTFAHRSATLRRVAAMLREQKTRLAKIVTTEMGKPIAEAEAEIEKSAWGCEYYADHAESYLTEQLVTTNAQHSYIAFRPLGVILTIMPWNFPFWQVFRAAAPALMAGNVVALKHAANVTECALEIERIFAACDLPQGAFTTLLVAGSEMERVVADPRIAAVTLTGSEGAGSAVAATCGKHLKKTVLELGGSDAFIVLADADVERAATVAARARFQNAGQSCIAAKRFIVEEIVYDRFVRTFAEHAKALTVGDPFDRAVQMGPLARPDLVDTLERQVRESVAQGAKLLTGGKRIYGAGSYYEPTILGEVTATMPVFTEETFGPVAAVTRAKSVEHALELANASVFGLGGNLWTRDTKRAEKLAARLESGAVFINGMTASDPRLPFGGVKRSGYGRELSQFGIREFVNIQTVCIG